MILAVVHSRKSVLENSKSPLQRSLICVKMLLIILLLLLLKFIIIIKCYLRFFLISAHFEIAFGCSGLMEFVIEKLKNPQCQ